MQRPATGARELRLPTVPFVGNLSFPEAPRWRAGQLWFSDMVAKRLCTVDADLTVRTVACFDAMPGGIGFLPDGTPLVVATSSARVLTVRDGRAEVYAELRDVASGHCDDMAVTADGTAYVGVVGEVTADMQRAPSGGAIVRVPPSGQVSRDAERPRVSQRHCPDQRAHVVGE